MSNTYTNKKRRVNLFVHPNVKRTINFFEDVDVQENEVGVNAEDAEAKAMLNEFAAVHITRTDHSMLQVDESFPVVEYTAQNTDRLNRFVEKVTVAIVVGESLIYDECGMATEEMVEDQVIAYVTNTFKHSTEITYSDFCRMLYKKPKLYVTHEGVLIFYTPDQIFATIDCMSGEMISVEELAKEVLNSDIAKIVNVETASEGRDTVVSFKTKKGALIEYKIKTQFNFFNENGVNLQIS